MSTMKNIMLKLKIRVALAVTLTFDDGYDLTMKTTMTKVEMTKTTTTMTTKGLLLLKMSIMPGLMTRI